jgi:hypothetical protein
MNSNDVKIGDHLGFIPRLQEDEELIYWYIVTNIVDETIYLDGFKQCHIEKYNLQKCFEDKIAFIANTEQEKLFYKLKVK